MKLFKKVLFALFPKILFVHIICYALLLIIAVKAIPVNTALHAFFNKWDILIIIVIAILGTLIFASKVFKIVFLEPNKGQRITRVALLSFIFMSIAIPNIIALNQIAIFHFGQIKNVNKYADILKHPEYSFFTIDNPDSLDDSNKAFSIDYKEYGRNRRTLSIYIYAIKLLKIDEQNIIIGNLYNSDYDYEGRASTSYIQRMIDVNIEKAESDFQQFQISSTDIFLKTFNLHQNEKFLTAAQLIHDDIDSDTLVIEKVSNSYHDFKRNSLILYLGGILVFQIILILFLATGKHFKENY